MGKGKTLTDLLYWIWFAFGFVVHGVTTTKRLACSNGKLTLSGDKALRNAGVTSTITDYYWKVRFSQTDWTQVNHCRSSAFCTTITSVLPDGTKVQVSANGALITLEHRAGSNANDHAEFLFEVNLVKNSQPSVEHHIFDVKFTVICIETLMGGKANLTKFLRDKLPWDQVTDLIFTDANSNKIAYCNTKQCTTTVNKNGNDPSLNWTNRFDETDGALVLTDIQKADNCREIRVEAHSGSGVGKVHPENLIWILVNTFSGMTSHASEIHAATDQPSVSTSKTVRPSSTVSKSNGVSPFSSVQSVTNVTSATRTGYATASCLITVSRRVWIVVISVIMTCIFVFV